MADMLTEVITGLKTALDTEFAAESIVFQKGKLHPANGLQGNVGGIYPETEDERAGRVIEQVGVVYVQVFQQWTKEIDPTRVVDPSTVIGWAGRLKRKVEDLAVPGTSTTWFYRCTGVGYQDDPTGARNRFLARVQAHGSNPAVVETGP